MKSSQPFSPVKLLLLMLLIAAFASQSLMAAEPLKVAVTPVPVVHWGTTISSEQTIAYAILLHINDSLSDVQGIHLAEEAWTSAVLSELRGGKRQLADDELFAAFTSYLPSDAFIDVVFTDGAFVCTIYAQPHLQRHAVEYAQGVLPYSIALSIGDFIADELKLPPEPAGRLRMENRVPEAFMATQTSRRRTFYRENTGEGAIERVEQHIQHVVDDPILVRALLEAGPHLTLHRGEKVKNPERMVARVRRALIVALGTYNEPLAMRFLEVNEVMREDVENDLLNLAERLKQDDLDSVLDLEMDTQGALLDEQVEEVVDPLADTVAGLIDRVDTLERRAGAIRALGLMRSEKGFDNVVRAANHREAVVRRAAAFALARYNGLAAAELLHKLALDDDLTVAFEAINALLSNGIELRQNAKTRLLHSVRHVARQEPDNASAAEMLAEFGTPDDAPLLRRLLLSIDPDTRTAAARGLFRLGLAGDSDAARMLADCSPGAPAVAIRNLPARDDASMQRLILLANNPYQAVADVAREKARRFIPEEQPARMLFELEIEHRYIRRQIVLALAESGEAWALDALEQAASNSHPHTRALAMALLVERDAQRAAPLIAAALSDTYHWTRFRAATLTPEIAGMIDTQILHNALELEQDPAARLYLKEAIALTEKRRPPEPQPPAKTIDITRNYAVLCPGHGEAALESPFEMYYSLSSESSFNGKVGELGKKSSELGKIHICRVHTAGNPTQVMLAHHWDDLWWRAVRGEIAETWQWIDGVILGEETMYAPSNHPDVWQQGWRAFCRETGIDTQRIAGDRSNLTVYEQRAWEYWEQRVAVEGFNEIYDFIKLYYGKLRPGFMVGTFMPSQDTPKPMQHQWKFDFAGAYYYQTHNQLRHAMVRAHRTAWPDRPLLWLSLGQASIWRKGSWAGGGIKYDIEVPEAPVLFRHGRAYSHSIAAWMAGGISGIFQAYLFMKHDAEAGGVWVMLESIGKDIPALDKAIDNVFADIEGVYRLQAVELPDAVDVAAVEDHDIFEGIDEFFDAAAEEKQALSERIQRDKERFKLGFFLEQKYTLDSARIMSGLPMPKENSQVLWVGYGPQLDWSTFYDYQPQLNELAWKDLSRYRFIGFVGQDKTPLRDSTLAALEQWLHEQPGLLYVRGALSTDKTNHASTPDDISGILNKSWQWVDCSAAVESKACRCGRCTVLQGKQDAPELTTQCRI